MACFVLTATAGISPMATLHTSTSSNDLSKSNISNELKLCDQSLPMKSSEIPCCYSRVIAVNRGKHAWTKP